MSEAVARAVARKHGWTGDVRPMPQTGIVNEIWAIGDDLVLRLPLEDRCVAEAENEALIVPTVVAAGILTPELVVFDADRDVAPRPYTVYRRAPGAVLGGTRLGRSATMVILDQVAEQAVRLHALPAPEGLPVHADPEDSYEDLKTARDAGVLDVDTAAKIEHWLDKLSTAPRPSKLKVIHWDLHPWNLLVDPEKPCLTAILDWGDAAVTDPAYEFTGYPIWALPPFVEAYHRHGGEIDDGFEARLLFHWTSYVLWEMVSPAMHRFDRRWWRLPAGGWRDILEEWAGITDERWRACGS